MCREIIIFCNKKRNSYPKIAVIVLFFTFLIGCASVQTGLYHDVEGVVDAAHDIKYKPSFSYNMLITGIRLSGYKKNYTGDAQTIIANTQRYNSGLRQLPPNAFYRRFNVTETRVNDHPYFFISPRESIQPEKIVVFLYGGGFMLGIDFMHWDAIERIVTELSVPVCVPLYPIYPETNLPAAVSFIDEVFAQLHEAYPDARIIGMGDSSGSCLLLSYCRYLTETDAQSFPDRLILVSPAQVARIDEETQNEMRVISKIDPGISFDIVKSFPVIFNLSDDDDNWFYTPLFGDFSLYPPIYVFAGTRDIFYPLVQPFVERVRLQGKTIELYTGIGMIHDWPYMPIARESRYALDRIMEIIDRD
jgi:acetyl esterase/lipase